MIAVARRENLDSGSKPERRSENEGDVDIRTGWPRDLVYRYYRRSDIVRPFRAGPAVQPVVASMGVRCVLNERGIAKGNKNITKSATDTAATTSPFRSAIVAVAPNRTGAAYPFVRVLHTDERLMRYYWRVLPDVVENEKEKNK